MAIKFYRVNDAYGCFSNFAKYGFYINDKFWKTSEHFFQAQKFKDTEYEEMIFSLESPMEAAKIGRSKELPLRKDWEQIKEDIMRKAVYEKFHQNPSICEILLSTSDELIIKNSPYDYYWGCGRDGSGQNRLGIILMDVRNSLRSIN